MEQEIMTIEEVAAYLKINKRTIFRMLKDGRIHGFKAGSQWRFIKNEIDKMIGGGKNGNTIDVPVVDNTDSVGESAETTEVPVVGQGSCGPLMLAEENIEETIPVSVKVAKPPFKYFMLKAKGDSMNLAGIREGDLVLVRKQSTAQKGDKVVALVGDEATIKEFHPSDNVVVLKPKSDNPKNKPVIVDRDFSVLGVVVSVIPGI